MELIDTEVLATLQDDVLRPAVIDRACALALEDLSPTRLRQQHERLEAELAHVEQEGRRLADAIGRGGPLDALVERLQICQARRDELRTVQRTTPRHGPAGSLRALDGRIRAKLADWRQLLTRDVEQGRQVLRLLLAEPFRFTPVVEGRRRGYQFTGTVALDRIVSGLIDLPQTLTGVASPTGPDLILRRDYVVEVAAA